MFSVQLFFFQDFTCSSAQTSNWVNQCLQTGFRQSSPITQILMQCTIQSGYTINCNQNSLVQLENCVQRMSNYGYQGPSPAVTRCLRQVLVPQVTSCLRMRYPRLNRYLPLNGNGIYSSIGSLSFGTGTGIGYSAFG